MRGVHILSDKVMGGGANSHFRNQIQWGRAKQHKKQIDPHVTPQSWSDIYQIWSSKLQICIAERLLEHRSENNSEQTLDV